MLLSYLIFMIYHILSDRSWPFNFDFAVDRTCMISHIVTLSSLRHKSYPIKSVMTVQFCFWSKAKLYNQSHQFLIYSTSYTAHYSIGLDNSVSYSMKITLYDWWHCCPIWFSWLTTSFMISHENSIPISVQTISIWLVMLLSCLVFVIDHTLSDRS